MMNSLLISGGGKEEKEGEKEEGEGELVINSLSLDFRRSEGGEGG